MILSKIWEELLSISFKDSSSNEAIQYLGHEPPTTYDIPIASNEAVK